MITTRKRIVTFFVLERLCKAYQWVSFDPLGSKAPAMSKKKDCNQYFRWVTSVHYDKILTAVSYNHLTLPTIHLVVLCHPPLSSD